MIPHADPVTSAAAPPARGGESPRPSRSLEATLPGIERDEDGKPRLPLEVSTLYGFGHLIRSTELLLLELFTKGLLSGTTHTCLGQELCQMAVGTGAGRSARRRTLEPSKPRTFPHLLGRLSRSRRGDHGPRARRVQGRWREPAPGLPALSQQRRAGRHDRHWCGPRARREDARRRCHRGVRDWRRHAWRGADLREPQSGLGMARSDAVRGRAQWHRANHEDSRHHRRIRARPRRRLRPAHMAM